MWSSSSEAESPASSPTRNSSPFPMETRRSKKKPKQRRARAKEEEEEEEMGWRGMAWEEAWPRKGRIGGGGGGGSGGVGGVMLEGYVEGSENGSERGAGEGEVGRTKSLTDDDLEELKGCLDLGFGFSYEEIPELCSTLPALELCYSMSQRFLDEQSRSAEGDVAEPSAASAAAVSSPPIANWRISSPGALQREIFSCRKSARRFTWSKLVWSKTSAEAEPDHAATECAVCLDEFRAGDELTHLPCAHRFHRSCAVPWLEISPNCPFCRTCIFSIFK